MQPHHLLIVPPQREFWRRPRPTASTASAGVLVALADVPDWPALVSTLEDDGFPLQQHHWFGRTLPRSQGWRRSKHTLLWQLWLCSFLQLTTSPSPLPPAPLPPRHALHADDGKKTTERTIRAWGQPIQESTSSRAHANLHRDDSRLSGISEPSIVASVPSNGRFHSCAFQTEGFYTQSSPAPTLWHADTSSTQPLSVRGPHSTEFRSHP